MQAVAAELSGYAGKFRCLDLETNKWQPAQKLGHPAPHATLGRWVKPGARCPCSRKPTQNLLQSGQGLGGIFPWIRTGQAV